MNKLIPCNSKCPSPAIRGHQPGSAAAKMCQAGNTGRSASGTASRKAAVIHSAPGPGGHPVAGLAKELRPGVQKFFKRNSRPGAAHVEDIRDFMSEDSDVTTWWKDGECVGMAVSNIDRLRSDDSKKEHVVVIVVDEFGRGQGIGRNLVSAHHKQIATAYPDSVNMVVGEVHRSNEASVAMFKKLGYKAIDTSDDNWTIYAHTIRK